MSAREGVSIPEDRERLGAAIGAAALHGAPLLVEHDVANYPATNSPPARTPIDTAYWGYPWSEVGRAVERVDEEGEVGLRGCTG
ncbi:MAG: hypothetical protein U0163_06930 [Gemmatimonadaceae bacterium]